MRACSPSWGCLLVPYSTCARVSCLLRLGRGGAPVSHVGSWPLSSRGRLGAWQWPGCGGVDLGWGTCWGWAAAGGPGLSFTFGAREEESSQASGRVTEGHLVTVSCPSQLCGPSSAPPSPVALPALLLALRLGFLFCVRVDSGCLF